MKWFIRFNILIYCFFCSISFAQKMSGYKPKNLTAEEAEIFDNAEFYFEEKNYPRSLSLYTYLDETHPDEHYFKFMAGRCCIYIDLERKNAIKLLSEIENTDNPVVKKEILLYLGKAYHINNDYPKAIEYFNKYLETGISVNDRLLVKQYIEQCRNGEKILKEEIILVVNNIGPEINSSASEYVPLITSDGSVIIYTYRGERSMGGLMNHKLKSDADGIFYEDIFISNNVGGHWLYPTGIADNINTKGHDASIAFSSDGQTLFLFRSTAKDNGDIYVSRLNGDQWSNPLKLGKNINTPFWEGSCSLSADELTLYFSSEQPGGLGGRDIWVSEWENGDWGIPKNLGPTINTPYNDDAPFIHPDGVTLFFSSEGHNSIGGYDVFYTKLKNDEWVQPKNMGMPVNTAGDERYYVLSADGEKGFFSSDRQGGFGQQDIYVVTPAVEGEPPPLALFLGTVTMNDKPVGATINVKNVTTGADGRKHQANSLTGKYLLALTPGNEYKIAIEVEGTNSNIQYLNIKALDTYIKVEQNILFYTEEYRKENGLTEEQSNTLFQKGLETQIQKFKEENNTEFYEANKYKEILKKYGDEVKEGVEYIVELGTFENPDDFDATQYAGLGKIVKKRDEKGNTVYSIGSFNNLLDAEIFKYKVIAADTNRKNNIVVTVNDNGERKIIQQYKAVEYKKANYKPLYPQTIKSQSLLSLDDNEEYNNLVKDKGNFKIDGLIYKLEVGTFTDTNEFNKLGLEKYGKIGKKLLPDGSVRYTLGEFQTLAEIDAFRKKVASESPDTEKSFVTVFYFEQRKSVKEFFTTDSTAALVNKKGGNSKTSITARSTGSKGSENIEKKESSSEKEEALPVFTETPCDTSAPTDFSLFVGKDLNNPEVYAQLVNMAGRMCVEGLIFTVQIGAYRFPQNYKYSRLRVFGAADIKGYPDGITRFTMKEFKTLKDAEAFRQQVIKRGTNDAWITAWYKGNRMLLTELIPLNFYSAGIN